MSKSNNKPCTCYVHKAALDADGIWAIQVGCGKFCTNRFAPGHDAQTKSVLIKAHRAGVLLVINDPIGGVRTDVNPLAEATRLGWAGHVTDATPKAKRQTPKAKATAAMNDELAHWGWSAKPAPEVVVNEVAKPTPKRTRKVAA